MTSSLLTLNDIHAALPEGAARYAHIAGVVRTAEQIEKSHGKFGGNLILAALYHDCGYAEKWRVTKFHALDGALAARQHGLSEDIAEAVLYHSGSWKEAQLLRPDIKDYYAPECLLMKTPLSRALTFCDLHTGLDGQRMSLDERAADVRHRRADIPSILQTWDEYNERFHAIENEWLPFLDTTKGLPQ